MTEKDAHVSKQLSKNPKFEIGDVVRLTAGSPSMNIRNVDGDNILCEWFDKATPRVHIFLKAQLVHTNPEQTPIININIGDDKNNKDTPPWKRS